MKISRLTILFLGLAVSWTPLSAADLTAKEMELLASVKNGDLEKVRNWLKENKGGFDDRGIPSSENPLFCALERRDTLILQELAKAQRFFQLVEGNEGEPYTLLRASILKGDLDMFRVLVQVGYVYYPYDRLQDISDLPDTPEEVEIFRILDTERIFDFDRVYQSIGANVPTEKWVSNSLCDLLLADKFSLASYLVSSGHNPNSTFQGFYSWKNEPQVFRGMSALDLAEEKGASQLLDLLNNKGATTYDELLRTRVLTRGVPIDVRSRNIEIRRSPAKDAPSLRVLEKGETVEVVEGSDTYTIDGATYHWYRVIVRNRVWGYIAGKELLH